MDTNKILAIAIFLTSSISSAYSQTNLIQNGGFETYSNIPSNTGPDLWSYDDDGIGGGVFVARPNCQVSFTDVSSSSGNTLIVNCDPSNSYFGNQTPASGNNYVGMVAIRKGGTTFSWDNSKLGYRLSNALSDNKKYILRFKVSKMDNSDNHPRLKVFFDDTFGAQFDSDRAKVYNEKIYSDGAPNNTSWNTVEIIFEVKDNGLDWLKFKMANVGSVISPAWCGVYIDDVELYEYCDYKIHTNYAQVYCTQTSGWMQVWPGPLAANGMCFHLENSPFRLDFSPNVRKAEVEIRSISTALVRNYSYECTNGIDRTLYWDGRNNSGAEAQGGQYIATVYLYNNGIPGCYGDQTVTFFFTKLNWIPQFTDPIIHLQPECVNPQPIQYKECCPMFPSIVITNEIFANGSINSNYLVNNTFVYRMVKDITLGPNVELEDGVNLSLMAGNSITISPPTNLKGNFHMSIIPCPYQRPLNSEDSAFLGNSQETSGYEFNLDNTSSLGAKGDNIIWLDLNNVIIAPNPVVSGYFKVLTNSKISHTLRIEIYDSFNRLIQSSEINSSDPTIQIENLSSGVYFVKVRTEREFLIRKIIKV